jgi:hypothetical protein
MPKQTPISLQPPLIPELEQELVLAKAKELFGRSRYLQGRYASFQRLLDDPLVGRSLLLGARQCLRQGKPAR